MLLLLPRPLVDVLGAELLPSADFPRRGWSVSLLEVWAGVRVHLGLGLCLSLPARRPPPAGPLDGLQLSQHVLHSGGVDIGSSGQGTDGLGVPGDISGTPWRVLRRAPACLDDLSQILHSA